MTEPDGPQSRKPGPLAKEPSVVSPGSGTATAGDELLEPAIHRLGLLAAFFAGFIAVQAIAIFSVRQLSDDQPSLNEILWETVAAVAAVAILVGLYAAIRTRALSLHGLVKLGIGSWIVLALLLSLADHADHFWRNGHRLHGIPWVCLIIMLVPFFFPVSTRAVALTGLVMAATGPVAMWMFGRRPDYQTPHLAAYLDVLIPGVLATLLSLIPARVIQHLGAAAREARRLGSYVLEEKLGQGGMGEVWRARHRLLARQAAVKLIRPSALGASSTVLDRFGREAQATASLRSPHSVALYDYGVSDDGHLYYAMELLDGLDLDRLVQRFGPQPAGRVVPWLLQICHSLHEAHLAGLVHRDIKPANVFVCRYGADHDFVKVLDFGLVALRGDSTTDDPQLTAEGIICGTPAYLAPELASGRTHPDGRTDLYALGCVAYWLLTGGPVFEGRTPVEIIAGHLERAPAPLSARGATDLPGALEQLILSCLAKSPDERPSSVEELRQGLEALPLEDAWDEERAAAWWNEHLPEGADVSAGGTDESSRPDWSASRDTPVRPVARRD